MEENIRSQIKNLVHSAVEKKLNEYASESDYKPFFEAIFDKETIITASIMQSLYTSFGMSIYEQIAVILAQNAGYQATRQYDLRGTIDNHTESLIIRICADLVRKPDKKAEIEMIRESIQPGEPNSDPERRVDVFVVKPDGKELYVDITTVKPNLKEFRALRRKMLRWCALRFSQDPSVTVKTCIGIPYNPYYPNDYQRWTANSCDPQEDLLVQNDLWREFSGYDVFPELIELFQQVGIELRDKLSDFMRNRS
jgi:hypothetical protein